MLGASSSNNYEHTEKTLFNETQEPEIARRQELMEEAFEKRNNGELSEAERLLDQVLEDFPDYDRAREEKVGLQVLLLFEKINAHLHDGAIEDAKKLVETILESDPDNENAKELQARWAPPSRATEL